MTYAKFEINSDDLDANGSVQLNRHINFKKVVIERFTFFNTAYNVAGKSVSFTEDLASVLTTTVVPLTDDFYTVAEFIAYLKTILDANSPNGWTYTISIVASKIVITPSAGLVSFNFTSATNDIRQLLGYKTDTTPSANPLTSPYVPQASPIAYYVVSPELGSFTQHRPFIISSTSTNYPTDTILVVDIAQPESAMIQYINYLGTGFSVDHRSGFNRLTFKLVDQRGRQINLNGSQWRMELGYYV